MDRPTAGAGDEVRPAALGTGLVVDIDRRVARAVLLGSVEGQGRLLASASVPSTVLPPIADPSVAVKQALRVIEEQTGMVLFGHDGGQHAAEGGPDVQYFAVTGQPTASLRLAVIPAGKAQITGGLVAAARRTNTVVEILGANVRTPDGVISGALLEQRLRAFRPDMVALIEGVGADVEWTTCVGTLAGLGVDNVLGQIVIVASDHLQQHAAQVIGAQADLRGIDPSEFSSSEIAFALETELATLYESRVDLRAIVPGAPAPRFVSATRAGDLVARFIARRRDQSVVVSMVGDGLVLHWAGPDGSETVIRPDIDVHGNVRAALAYDAGQITRWLPFALSTEDLFHWILNRALRPHARAETPRDMALEAAIITAALRDAWDGTAPGRVQSVDNIIGGQGLGEWSSPAMAVLALLNAFQPTPRSGMVDIVLDVDGIVAAAGAIGEQSPALAADAVELDLMMPTASVVVVEGSGTEGEVAVRGRLSHAGGTVPFSVPFGSLLRLPLPPGRSGELTLTCEQRFSVGGHPAMEEVVFGRTSPLHGSEVGVVIDARGRPLQAGADPARVTAWLDALEVKR